MHKHPILLMAVFAAAILLPGRFSGTAARGAEPEAVVREIYVPFEDLDVLLEDQPQRVLLSREEYEELLGKASVVPRPSAPLAATVVSADYVATVEPERARLTGTLVVDVLEDGLHAVPLDLSGVGLRRATLDGQAAPVGRAENVPLTLFVEGRGRHQLLLEMVAPLETTAATQVLNLRLPRPPAATLRLTVPGDVEVKSGADVAGRLVDEAAGVTRFELLPTSGDMTLVMTLNSRLARLKRAVVARSVVVDEVTEAYERLHATVSLRVLHRAVEEFRLLVPSGFEITEVSSPLLARWAVEEGADGRVLDVRLREQTTETVVLNLSAVRSAAPSDDWTFPKLEPLDVIGQVSVVGLLVDQRLSAESIAHAGLIHIDTAVLNQAIPETVFKAEPGAPTLRPVVAYYAPQSQFELSARFVRPPAEISVMTNLLLLLGERDQQVRGELFLSPEVEKLFSFDFSVPPAWHVTSVTTPDGNPLAFERYRRKGEPGRIHVRLPQGVPPGEEFRVYFNAQSSPANWLGKWESAQVEFPVFAVAGAAEDVGALAVEAPEGEMEVRLISQKNLVPLDAAERQKYGLEESDTSGRVLAYRYEAQPYQATLLARRTPPRLTAKTFSFLRVESGALDAHYEIVYQVEGARVRQLSLLLAKETPADLSIEALDGVRLKQFTSSAADGARRWTAMLEEPRKGTIRLAVDFRQPFPEQDESAAKQAGKQDEQEVGDLPLPVVRADKVDYQSGLVAVEGNAELEVRVSTDARRVDVGELTAAQRQPGRGLLGVFGFVGEPPEVKIDVFRRPGYRLHPTIVQRAGLATRLSATGESVSVARFELRTKAVYLELKLPANAKLWSAELDGEPLKPQREGDHLLMSLPADSGRKPRELRFVYQMPVDPVGISGDVELSAPTLRLRADRRTEGVEVPTADLVWDLYPPPGYQVVRSEGTVLATIERPEPAIFTIAKAACGIAFFSPPIVQHLQGAPALARRGALQTPYYLAGDAEPDAALPIATTAEGYADDYEYGAEEAVAPMEAAGAEEAQEEPKAEEMMEAGVEQAAERTRRGSEAAAGEVRAHALPADRVVPLAELEPEPQVPTQPPAKAAGMPSLSLRRFGGFDSLNIDLEEAPETAGKVTFQSLGVQPRLVVRLANGSRFGALAWAVALAVALVGLAISNRSVRAKCRFILVVVVVGSLVPLVPGWEETALPLNAAVYAACLLVPYYLLVGCLSWLVALCRRRPSPRAVAAAAASVAILACTCLVGPTFAAEPQHKPSPYVIQVIEEPEPVKVPDDAVILPYDPESDSGVQDADQMLVPYAKYVELWNLAYPDKKMQVEKPPAAFALAGASYSTRLAGDEYLLVEGELEIDVYVEEDMAVPLGLAGGVLAAAELDGNPARLSVPQVAGPNPSPQPARQQRAGQVEQQGAEPGRAIVLLHVSGKGRHRLRLGVRMRLERRGGWRVAEGILPWAPAASLSITVPQPETDVRLGQVVDRQSYDSEQPDELIETALGPGGALSIQWRGKVAVGQVDRSLTAQSAAVIDVQEDGLRLVWQLGLDFPRSQREVFSVDVPAGYLVERVQGDNVRGWEVSQEGGRQTVEVSLLKAARDRESFAVHLWRTGPVGQGDLSRFDVPVVAVPDAAMHNGRLTIRRSLLLDLKTESIAGVTQTDLGDDAPGQASAPGGNPSEESPLGIRAYESYEFVATPFSIRLVAAPLVGRRTAKVETVVKISEVERSLESRVNLLAEERPVHSVQMFLPDDLDLDEVSAPGDFQWALTRRDDRRLLTVYLAAGAQGLVQVRVAGTLARQEATDPLPLPRLEVAGVAWQEGQIAVEADPAFDVAAEDADLEHCEKVPLSHLYGWLNPQHRQASRLAIYYSRPDYRGTLRISLRQPAVTCETITNVRVTDRAIEETLLLDFTVEEAGIRQIEFLLPHRMRASRINVPMLRQKTIEPVDQSEGSPVNVRLELQDDVMGQLRVLVENDRVLTHEPQAAPIPVVRTGRTLRQAVVLQSAGRDEVIVDPDQLAGLEPAHRWGIADLPPMGGRRQSGWEELREILGGITRAYVAVSGFEEPRLVFQAKQRKAFETARARIGLCETNLVLDPAGAYRGEQVYRLDNTTEQFLVIKLPEGARLWTALVAGQPAKPTRVPDTNDPCLVRIPLVKTAPGDLDYAVVLKYGGSMPALGTLASARRPVDFPLIQTVNIKVELSQVRLHLPETYRWFNFAGTMGRPGEEEALMAGFISYQTKQAERLLDTMQKDSAHARRRAANNMKQLGLALHNYHDSLSHRAQSRQVQEEYARNYEVLQKGEQQLQQLAELSAERDGTDNRIQLNTLFGDQKTSRARNVVQDLGRNWDVSFGEQMPAAGQQPAAFNRKWLEGNKLSNTMPVAGKEAEGADRLPSQTGGGKARLRLEDKAKKAPAPAEERFRATRFQEGKPASKGQPARPPGGPGAAPAAGRRPQTEGGGYGDRLEQHDAPGMVPEHGARRRGGRTLVIADGSSSMISESFDDRAGVYLDMRPRSADTTLNGVADVDSLNAYVGFAAPAGEAADAGIPAGLASLDVQLPMRGTVYRFTTPGGDVQITARAIPSRLLDRLIQLGVIIAVVLVVFGVVRLYRRGALRWLAGRAGSWCLLLVGLLSLCVFPVMGLAAIVAGIVIKIRRIASASFKPSTPKLQTEPITPAVVAE